jgi:hypothetical protein
MKLVNLGCSFSYGNCVSNYETLSEEHVGPGTLIAKHLDYEEVNLASPGLSLDGVLRRLYTFDFDRNSTFLVGLPPESRFQVVSTKPRNQKKIRGGPDFSANAFNNGPTIPTDWFLTQSWLNSFGFKNYNVSEHVQYHTWFNILLIQKRLQELNCKYWLYNSVYGHMQNTTEIPELQTLKDSISLDNYYQPNLGIRDFSDTDIKYQISRDDSHPNRLCYKEWVKEFVDTFLSKRIWVNK